MPPAAASTTAPSKEALCIIVDVSHAMSSGASFEDVKQTCNDFIIQKMLYSPSDEVGLIFAGTNGTKNRLNAMSPANFQNITVMRPVMKPTGDFMSDVATAVVEQGPLDMFESILCAADLINESTANKKYNRRIMLMSQVADPVKNKKALTEVQNGLAAQGISLVVIGVDFTVTDDMQWPALTTTKQQNERVIAIICQQLGENSFVFPVRHAMEALNSLRKRNVSERTSTRAILSVGDVKLAVYIYSKTLQGRVPTLKKASSSSATNSNVTIDRRYFVASTMQEVDPSDRIKVLKYGRSVVPCTSMDEEQMKFVSDRSLDCLGFINTTDIPPHILMGGCKAVGPAIGDGEGATALAAFVQGMVHLGKAMLVRYVRCANASPSVCACFPSSKQERHILYMVTLPYAEDFRRYLLPDFAHVVLNTTEANAIDDMVTAMTLPSAQGEDEDELLKLNKVYNPSLQQYYSWVRARYLQTRAVGAATAEGMAANAAKAIGQPLPSMPAEVRASATCWGEAGNVLYECLRQSRPSRDRVAKDFPFTPPQAVNAPGKEAKAYWFGQQGAVATASANGEPAASRGPRTEGSSSVGQSAGGGYASPGSTDHYLSSINTQVTLSSASNGTALGAPPPPGANSARAVMAINTANPVASFLAMVGNKAMDQVEEGIFRMGELVLTLLKLSIGNQFFAKCEQCVRALRSVCVDEDEPASYLAFLQRLMLMTKGGTHDHFWTHCVVANGLGPITTEESPASAMTPQQAMQFVTEGIKAPAPPALDDDNHGADELLDLLE